MRIIEPRHHRPAQHITAPTQVLGGGMHHHVTTQRQWLLKHRAGKGVVSNGTRAVFMGNRRDGRNINTLQQRVGRCFDPDDFRLRGHGLAHVVQVRHVDK